MTIEKLARLIVDDYYQGAIGDEIYNVAVEREIKRLRQTIREDSYADCLVVDVEVEP
jgi:hypothetical protein